jgi:hypothetical protein
MAKHPKPVPQMASFGSERSSPTKMPAEPIVEGGSASRCQMSPRSRTDL